MFARPVLSRLAPIAYFVCQEINVADPIQIRMGGYGPPTTTHSRALKFIGDRLEAQFGDGVDVKYIWNLCMEGSL